ncbi:MAG TPA: PEP/pyruvate-binding domain-containing protein, partial [Myxococcota bacterium]|nr:PEP/pyruvate-binding domain-containing protein [Myxococcota bacterium]
MLYRLRNGFPHRAVSLSVVVQKMVQPESAGILFTADPVGGSRNIVSIDAGWGLGEALVSGLVTADLYRAEKETGKLLSVKVGDKAIAIRSLPEGGTAQEALPPDRRQAQVLSEARVAELVAMGRRIEAAAGGLPQDVEWCYEAGKLHIVQARPITSLYPLPADPKGPVRLYFSFSHAQMMTDAMPTLAADLWFWLFPFGRASLTGNPADASPTSRAMTEVGGRLYLEVTQGLANPRSRPLLLGLMSALYPQLTEAMEGQLHRLGPPQPMDPATRRGLLRFFAPVPFRLFRRLWWARPETANAEATATLDAILTGHRQALAQPTTLAGRLRAARDRLAVTFTIVPQVAPFLVAGVLAQRILGKLGVPEEALNRLARALPGNVTTDMDLLLADLADRVRGIPGLAELLEQRGLAGAKEHPGSGPFLSAFQDFLDRYGMRGPGEIDLSRPRWGDRPESLLPMILGNLRGDQPVGAHRRRHADMEAEATQ